MSNIKIVITHKGAGYSTSGAYIEAGYFVIKESKWNQLVKDVKKYRDLLNIDKEVESNNAQHADINPYEYFQEWTIHDISELDVIKSTSLVKTSEGIDFITELIDRIKSKE